MLQQNNIVMYTGPAGNKLIVAVKHANGYYTIGIQLIITTNATLIRARLKSNQHTKLQGKITTRSQGLMAHLINLSVSALLSHHMGSAPDPFPIPSQEQIPSLF